MDRRKSLKIIAGTAIAGGATLAGCNPSEEKKPTAATEPVFTLDRNPDELKHEKELLAQGRFFTDHEMATLTILCDIIIPRDDVSGSASDAKVPEFIEFIVKDMPGHQTPLRGGLRWIDIQSLKRFDKAFADLTQDQQLNIVDDIAYPERTIKPGMEQGVSFFTLLRNLASAGFYTSEIGVKDIGYIGNVANQWNGVPPEVLQQYNLAYTEKELKECISFDKK